MSKKVKSFVITIQFYGYQLNIFRKKMGYEFHFQFLFFIPMDIFKRNVFKTSKVKSTYIYMNCDFFYWNKIAIFFVNHYFF